nr:transposase [uncultured Anaerobutyricum sp.]
MLLSQKTSVKLTENAANFIGHMCYAAYKLWNVCNYERYHYKELNLKEYPDWYYQKKAWKDSLWFKQLPSQTAQEVCKLLDKSWKSFYALKKSGGIENPNPPRFKRANIPVTYMQNGIVHQKGTEKVRLSLAKKLKEYMGTAYDIHENFLFLENKIFKGMDVIKQIKIYPPEKGRCRVIVIYEMPDAEVLPDNGRYLSIDPGVHNLLTCFDAANGKSFIVGRKYLSFCHRYYKEIARVQSQWYSQQVRRGMRYRKSSRHIKKLYEKKKNVIRDYLHKITRYVVEYCKREKIHTVIMGDLKNIRKEKRLGNITNQKLHELPFDKIKQMLSYKLKKEGICFILQNEAYTSQCSPVSPEVKKEYGQKENRKKRGLYREVDKIYNADAVGAYNILRKYLKISGIEKELSLTGIERTWIIKVAV